MKQLNSQRHLKLAFDFIYTSTNIKHKVAVLRGEFQQVTFFNKLLRELACTWECNEGVRLTGHFGFPLMHVCNGDQFSHSVACELQPERQTMVYTPILITQLHTMLILAAYKLTCRRYIHKTTDKFIIILRDINNAHT